MVRTTGKIAHWIAEKRYGFITSDAGGDIGQEAQRQPGSETRIDAGIRARAGAARYFCWPWVSPWEPMVTTSYDNPVM